MSDPVVAPAIIAAPAPTTAVVVAPVVPASPAIITLAGYAMLGLGLLLILMLAWIFWKAQRGKSKIDMEDLLLDPTVGKITQGRFWGLIGGASGTWVFIYLPVSGHFDSTYAVGYLAAVFALKVAGDITGKPTPSSAESTVEKVAASGASEKTAVKVTDVPTPHALQAAGRGVEPIAAEAPKRK